MEEQEDLERLRRLLRVQKTEIWSENASPDPADENLSERYAAEERILRAVENGDFEEALEAMRAFGDVHKKNAFDDDAAGSRLWLVSLNNLFRRRVQMAKVHPSYINRVAAYFNQAIVEADRPEQFTQLVTDMLREYCRLVREYSLKDYSQLVRDVINYVDFHIQEELDLASLAERAAVSGGYLSRRFKQEVGITLTEYISNKRVERAKALLRVTELPVSEVAATVGILDGNYFSRLFRKQTGMSPSGYRSSHREQEQRESAASSKTIS